MKKLIKIVLCTLLVVTLMFVGILLLNNSNFEKMTEYIDSFSAIQKENQLVPKYDDDGSAYFVTDDEFKVMQLTDVHLGGSFLSTKDDKKALNAIAAMIATEQPDLVVVTGDISFAVPWAATLNNKYAHDMFIRFMENLGVYWTVTFGNHDSEIYDYYTRSDVADFYSENSLTYCLFNRGPEDVYGECNHMINVRNSDGLITQTVIMMDSNSYTDEDPLGFNWIYDNIHQDQIEWYRSSIEAYNAHNAAILEGGDYSDEEIERYSTVKSLLFMHIPPMETRIAYDEYLAEGDTEDVSFVRGEVGESAPYVYCSMEEDQLFETMLELGSTKAVFYGHDHLNNIALNYKGIILTYGYSVDYFAYLGIDKTGSQRGCTIITCQPDTSITITHENYYQDKYVPLYEKEVVDMTK
ncbi:MAG: metallophosphoesterase [Clostridia bacterium]|nr:metallophosphoesterase [Clostridia bacterium]